MEKRINYLTNSVVVDYFLDDDGAVRITAITGPVYAYGSLTEANVINYISDRDYEAIKDEIQSLHDREKEAVREDVIEECLNIAVRHIQDHFKQTDGGLAGVWFSGNERETILKILADYYDAENHEAKREGRS